MPTKRIVVAHEYQSAFEAICNLIKSGYLDDKSLAVEGEGASRTIYDGTYAYVLGTDNGAGDEDEIFIDENGASWFRNFREQAKGKRSAERNQNAVWVSFIDTIGKLYHSKFSLVEYRQRKPSKQEAAESERLLTEYLDNVLGAFYPDIGAYTIKPLSYESNVDDIYGVSLKLELSGGTGAALPVLAKVYFRYENGKMLPLKSEEAQSIDDYLKEVPNGADDKGSKSNGSEIINKSLNALESLVSDPKNDFVSVMCFGDKIDADNVDDMCGKMANGEATLECSKVKVLGISHIKWNKNGADVIIGSRPVLRACIMLGGQLTVNCLACKSYSTLIAGNTIEYKDGYGDTVTCEIRPSRSDLGLEADEIESILENSELGKHLMVPSCGESSCSRLVCADEALPFDIGGRKSYFCQDCPYPDIVYKGLDPYAKGDYTPDLSYATDLGDLVPTDPKKDDNGKITWEGTDVCSCCGRRFSASALEYKNRCPLCASAGKETAVAHKTYRKYAGMLPPWVRIMNPGKHLCYEDDEILLFVLGNTRYVFNKLDIDENGYLPPPKRLGRF